MPETIDLEAELEAALEAASLASPLLADLQEVGLGASQGSGPLFPTDPHSPTDSGASSSD
eukprot:9282438-Alexandrium_andersonii.AAC.1